MPQFTNRDRLIVEAEGALHCILRAIQGIDNLNDTCWADELSDIESKVYDLWDDLSTYNDQFEEDE